MDNVGIMLIATAHYLERNINLYIYSIESESSTRLFSLAEIQGGDAANEHPPLTIFYYNNYHNQTLQPVEASKEGLDDNNKGDQIDENDIAEEEHKDEDSNKEVDILK